MHFNRGLDRRLHPCCYFFTAFLRHLLATLNEVIADAEREQLVATGGAQQPAVDLLFVLCALFLFARRSAALELRGLHRGLHLRELRVELLGRQIILGVIRHRPTCDYFEPQNGPEHQLALTSGVYPQLGKVLFNRAPAPFSILPVITVAYAPGAYPGAPN